MPIVSEALAQSAFDYMDTQGDCAAQATADAIIAEFRKKKAYAAVVRASDEKTIAMKEYEADGHPDYEEAVIVFAQAQAEVERHKHNRKRAEAIIEAWRTQESTARGLRKVG